MKINDIAKLAGVSTATVSRVLNNKNCVDPNTRDKILKIVNDHNFQPNMIAKGLASQKTYTIGVAIPDIVNPFYPEVFRGIEDISSVYGYMTIYLNTDYDVMTERKALSLLRNGRVDGLIVALSNRVIDECIAMVSMQYPIVMFGQLMDEVKCPKVGCNNFSSAYTITEYLINSGHKKIAHIAGHKETYTGIQRINGYLSAMENYRLRVEPEWIVSTNYFKNDAYIKTKELIDNKVDITAIFAANDSMVVGCYKAILEAGLKIPDDISFVGHDDIELATILQPALTTMRQEKRKIGNIAAHQLFSAIENQANNKKIEENIVIVPTTLIERDSVKKLS
ncbi:LacI family DNA-binding transcriptional regulator [Flexilinea flocculi]|uniref:Transcriptional regulator, LacI family n=1 Tax=Flexilinea flocculi TaxID=1678840 RepID=A0A0K8PA85_9CHLR|nr:LacI family DNA-binding transcriptional regulator [Flexilinea flocculi]GAP39568.1 transcriptional regulator, LacI family [Flexilinea flocculi]